MVAELLPLALMVPLLVAGAVTDLARRRIPNTLVLAGVALFVATVPLIGPAEAALRAIPAAVTLAVGFGLFALRLFGGGDVKMLAALMLFIPSGGVSDYLLCLSVSMIAGIAAIAGAGAVAPERWRGTLTMERGRYPMGVSIALSGILYLALALAA